MNRLIMLTTCVLVCGTSLAQAEVKNGMPMSMGASTMSMDTMGMKGMDTNSDGMVSKKEWKKHHNMMWKMMKNKNGKVPMADIEAMMKKC